MRAVVLSLWAMVTAGTASAQTFIPRPNPMVCAIDARSAEGGRLVVTTEQYGPANGLGLARTDLIAWHPPASEKTPIDLIYTYAARFNDPQPFLTLSSPLTKPNGAYAEMPLSVAPAAHLHARVSGNGGTSRVFDDMMGDETVGTVGVALTEKGFDEPVADGLAGWRSVRVEMMDADKPVASATFDATAVKGRGALMAYARHLVAISDPRVCRRMPS